MFLRAQFVAFQVRIIKWKFFQIVYYIFLGFNFFSELSLIYITKIFNLDNITNENNEKHNEKWQYIPDRNTRRNFNNLWF